MPRLRFHYFRCTGLPWNDSLSSAPSRLGYEPGEDLRVGSLTVWQLITLPHWTFCLISAAVTCCVILSYSLITAVVIMPCVKSLELWVITRGLGAANITLRLEYPSLWNKYDTVCKLFVINLESAWDPFWTLCWIYYAKPYLCRAPPHLSFTNYQYLDVMHFLGKMILFIGVRADDYILIF